MKILFQGDSITDCDRIKSNQTSLGNGYASKVAEIFNALYPHKDVTFINRGISGNRVIDLLERYATDFVDISPDIVFILIGVNDTWRRYDSNDATSTETFAINYRKLLQQIKSDLPITKIVIIEPFLLNTITERTIWREDLNPKIMEIRKLAREFADYYIPLDGVFQQYAVTTYKDCDMATDSVHPTAIGHEIISKEVLKALDYFDI